MKSIFEKQRLKLTGSFCLKKKIRKFELVHFVQKISKLKKIYIYNICFSKLALHVALNVLCIKEM